MKDEAGKPIIMGKLGAPHGVKGWIKVHPNTADLESLTQYSTWLIGRPGHWQSCRVEDCKINHTTFLAKFFDLETPEAVAVLTNQQIALDRMQLPPLTEDEGYYWADLEGATVVNVSGLELGKVAYLYEAGETDVMVVRNAVGDKHILFLEGEIVKQVSLEEHRIVVDWE